ncbi:MAG: hypothetical protein QW231_00405 [Candidatus Bathyarchaeia archaeon]
MKSVTITVRIPEELKESLGRYGVEVSKVVRGALEEEIRRRKLEDLKRTGSELGEFFAKMPEEKIVKSIRETRRSR